ncbi:APSES transcription factor Xbp1 [Colletotrichum higginsianum IMI 349063]|uniref:APSES transcription factor Xbp1 n=4 Tax=Colletotrichum higginsianum TaxID=80884 RepID=A0A1B7YAI8_COLHI|nr:APSES transcription factor Xbp1 [Colletotrichum higginsianum IMI 349063]OBR09086.1 APSES transcription factor Xbp1 [Colletotrichum higginsianum IMI 349063]TIC95284.1 Transcriptional repressor XBP1 [Colletotrichum higginsianum]GJC96855.1 APSES transcription factor Xbp1 [Colletotrichum higginsianum]
MSSPGTCYSDRDPSSPYLDQPVIPKLKMSKDPAPMSKYKPRGVIKYFPFENVDDATRREVHRFRVTPFGRIQESCAHIPYNSGKKDFFEKTGRESFEVFKYEFKNPGDDNDYTVMWDYNIGLVRMTPFFKCCKYSKTMPAKMLGLNPGLKDITHSITGGAIAAQGYWMPYECAKAVCATFCYGIAGALIPIFGPSFPSLCTPPGSPDYQRMAIDHRIVEDAIKDAELSRKVQHHALPPIELNQVSNIERRPIRTLRDDKRLRLDTRLMSPYSDTDGESHRSCPDSASSNSSEGVGYSYGHHPAPPRHSKQLPPTSGWTAANRPAQPYRLVDESYRPADPYLSAVPRWTPVNRHVVTPPRPAWAHKRTIDHDDHDGHDAAGRDSRKGKHDSSPVLRYASEQRKEEDSEADIAEQNAALGLMTLMTAPRKEVELVGDGAGGDSHRSKRRRATSA